MRFIIKVWAEHEFTEEEVEIATLRTKEELEGHYKKCEASIREYFSDFKENEIQLSVKLYKDGDG